MGVPQEHDPTRRRLIFHDIPIAIAGTIVLITGCDESEKPDPFTNLDLSQQLVLPAEPQEAGIEITEKVKGVVGYVYGEIIGMDLSFTFHPDIVRQTARLARIAVNYIDGRDWTKTLLTRDARDPQLRYYAFSSSPDGKTVAVGFQRKNEQGGRKSLNVKIVDIVSGREIILEPNLTVRPDVEPDPRDSREIEDLQWSHDSRYLSSKRMASIWEIASGKIVYSERQKSAGGSYGDVYDPSQFLWSPRENKVLVSSADVKDPILRIVDLSNGEKVHLEKYRTSGCGEVACVTYYTASDGFAQWSPDGEKLAIVRIAVASPQKDYAIHIVNKYGKELKTIPSSHLSRDLAWSPDGQSLAFFIDKDREKQWPPIKYQPSLVLLNIESGNYISIPTINMPQDSAQYEESVAQGGKALWTKQGIFMLVPTIERTDRRARTSSPPQVAVGLFSPEDLLSGKVKKIDGELPGLVVVGQGLASINSRAYSLPGNIIIQTIEVQRDRAGLTIKDNRLLRFDLSSGKTIDPPINGIQMEPRIGLVSERTKVLTAGEIIETEKGEHFLFINGKKYRISALDKFTRNRGRQDSVVEVSEESIKRIPEGTLVQEPFILDWAGRLTRNGKNGGQKVRYFAGWLTGARFTPYQLIEFTGTFQPIRRRLKENGFDEVDSLFYTYNKNYKTATGMFGYYFTDTMQDPLDSIELADELLTQGEKDYPLETENLICHSFGGISGLFTLERHLGRIRNAIFIDCPLKGLPPITNKDVRQKLAEVAGDKVVSFLRRAWESQPYQERIKKIVAEAREREVGVYTFGSTDDIVVPWQSAVVEGAIDTIDGKKIDLAFSMGRSFNPFHLDLLGHGVPLEHPKILEYIATIAGKNYASVP